MQILEALLSFSGFWKLLFVVLFLVGLTIVSTLIPLFVVIRHNRQIDEIEESHNFADKSSAATNLSMLRPENINRE